MRDHNTFYNVQNPKLTTPDSDKDVEKQEYLFISSEYKMIQTLWKTTWKFLAKFRLLLGHDPAITHPSNYPNELKIYIHTKICTRMSVTTLFIIAKTWKQSRCPSVSEWVNCGMLCSFKKKQVIKSWEDTGEA